MENGEDGKNIQSLPKRRIHCATKFVRADIKLLKRENLTGKYRDLGCRYKIKKSVAGDIVESCYL